MLCLLAKIMAMDLINIGFNNMVVAQRIVVLVSPDSAPIRRLEKIARENGSLVNATCGRKTRSVIITDNNHVILSALQPETIAERFPGNLKKNQLQSKIIKKRNR